MFNWLARLLPRIRKKPLTDEERLSREEARLQALLSLEERQDRWENSQPNMGNSTPGVGGGL